MSYIEELKKRVLSEGVLDGEDIHHEFVSGLHGRKLDFDKIETGSDFYLQWVNAIVKYIQENYDKQPNMIVGIANGANRLAVSVAAGLGNGTIGLMTEKDTPKSSKFYVSAEDVVRGYKPDFVLIVEDVGTAGTTSATAAKLLAQFGAKNVEVLNTWQRSETLVRLDESGVTYRSIIVEPMPNYEPADCDYCKNGVKFVPHA